MFAPSCTSLFRVSISSFSRRKNQKCMQWKRIVLRYASIDWETSETADRCSGMYLPGGAESYLNDTQEENDDDDGWAVECDGRCPGPSRIASP